MAEYLVNITVNGSGTVTGAGTYPENSEVTLTATPSFGYVFSGWYKIGYDGYVSSDLYSSTNTYATTTYNLLSNESSYTFNITEDMNIEALFISQSPNSYSISITTIPAVGGTFTIDGTTDSEGKYIEGTSVTLTATANSGYEFISWDDNTSTSGGILSYDNPYTFVIDKDMDISLSFNKIITKYTLRVKSNQPDYGRVSVNGATLETEEDAQGYAVYSMVAEGQVQLFGIANTGYNFVRWSNGNVSSSYVFIAVSDVTISATFEVTPLVPTPATILSFDSNEVYLDEILTGNLLLEDNNYNYTFYWGNMYSSQENVWIPSSLTTEEVKLEVGDVFENLLIYSTQDTFYLRVTAINQTESLYQQNIPFIVKVPDNYRPLITLQDISIHNAFNGSAIAGYSTFSTTFTTQEVPSNNSATVVSVSASANIGYCNIYFPSTIIGSFAPSSEDYGFVITGVARDTRKVQNTSTTNTITVLGYTLPTISLIDTVRCMEDGTISDNPDDNVYCMLKYTLTCTPIPTNRIAIRDLTYSVGDVSYRGYTEVDSEGIYTTILGGDLNPGENYIINLGVVDSVMKALDIERVIFSENLTGKLALSLLDNLQGKVGMAVGIEATLEDKVDLALDTYFRNNVKLQANTHVEGENKEASIESYDLIHNAVRVYEGDNTPTGTYGNILRAMTGQEYAQLRANEETDPHTFYYLSSPLEGQ